MFWLLFNIIKVSKLLISKNLFNYNLKGLLVCTEVHKSLANFYCFPFVRPHFPNSRFLHHNSSVFVEQPNFIAGFTDGEGCFTLGLSPNKVQPSFQIGLEKCDKAILEQIQKVLGVGYISISGTKALKYQVGAIKDLEVIIRHFDNYPLLTHKWSDFQLFKQAVVLVLNKEHLTEQGFRKLVAIKASLNTGLSDKLKESWPDIIPAPRPLLSLQTIKDPYWIAGFVNAEGCFSIDIVKSSGFKLGFQIRLRFRITQHIRDEFLMQSFTDFFNCGIIEKYSKGNAINYSVLKFSDITEKIIPFFKQYPIVGKKFEYFSGFCEAADLMCKKQHLTASGFERIKQIKEEILLMSKVKDDSLDPWN